VIIVAGGGSRGGFTDIAGGGGGGTFIYTAIPEPSTWAMMLIAFAGLGFVGYRASRRASHLAGG
jgi:PEP-CTERM motif